MRHAFFLCCLLAAFSPFARSEDEPIPAKERVVLHTGLGDLVIMLFSDEAPQTVAQFLKLVRLGVYDGTPFFKVNKDFFAQVSGIGRRRFGLAPDQLKAVHPLKGEPSALPARYGTLIMAHDVGKPDNAETSFIILLRDVPEMKGKYTIFGEVESGFETLEAIRSFPANAQHEPYKRIEVRSAYVVDNPEKLLPLPLRGPNRAYVGVGQGLPSRPYFIVALALSGIGVALFVLLFGKKPVWRATVSLIAALIGIFLLLAAYLPRAAETPGAGPVIFVLALVLFKLMSQFERAAT